jgi:hypothetical protein
MFKLIIKLYKINKIQWLPKKRTKVFKILNHIFFDHIMSYKFNIYNIYSIILDLHNTLILMEFNKADHFNHMTFVKMLMRLFWHFY